MDDGRFDPSQMSIFWDFTVEGNFYMIATVFGWELYFERESAFQSTILRDVGTSGGGQFYVIRWLWFRLTISN